MQVVITGASRGIGLALASEYTQRGAAVAGLCRTLPAARKPAGVQWLTADVTDPASLTTAAAALERVDLLICNAGIYLDKGEPLDTGYPPELWAQTFAVNVAGVFHAVQAFLPRMAAGGRIAVIASQLGSSANAGGGSYVYRASKAAAVNLARNLAVDLAPRGIAVGAYHPGWVRTDMGGPAAAVDPAESAAGLARQFDALGPESSGCFVDWTGAALPF